MGEKAKMDMTPRDALEYAHMREAYRLGSAHVVEFWEATVHNFSQLVDVRTNGQPPFPRPRTSAALERFMTDEEIAASLAREVKP